VLQEKNLYGSFYSGDAYIILYTYVVPGTKKMAYNVHFWLGKDSTQDEQGTAAYKTVELDDFLGTIIRPPTGLDCERY
jgi:gelsolin